MCDLLHTLPPTFDLNVPTREFAERPVECHTNGLKFIASGPAPLMAARPFGTCRSATAIVVYIAVFAVITLVATAHMIDYTGEDISGEYESR
jgi:hypothetical protein